MSHKPHTPGEPPATPVRTGQVAEASHGQRKNDETWGKGPLQLAQGLGPSGFRFHLYTGDTHISPERQTEAAHLPLGVSEVSLLCLLFSPAIPPSRPTLWLRPFCSYARGCTTPGTPTRGLGTCHVAGPFPPESLQSCLQAHCPARFSSEHLSLSDPMLPICWGAREAL